MPIITFGYEAEFDTGATDVIRQLHAMGLAGDNRLHGYHCDCPTCSEDYDYRGQTDSSCSGEIISNVRYSHADSENATAMRALEEAACAVDAEPGYRAGFHVHVGRSHLPEGVDRDEFEGNAFWQFLRWEPVLLVLAAGRFTHQRQGQNATVRDSMTHALEYIVGRDSLTNRRVAELNALDDEATVVGRSGTYRTWRVAKEVMRESHHSNDRHSNLNINTRHLTWEFRLWNSTRSAWRMEMFTGLSVAWMDPAFQSLIVDVQVPERIRRDGRVFADLAAALDLSGHGRAAEYVTRQTTYLRERVASTPSVFTSF